MSQSKVIPIAEVLHRTPAALVLACGFMIVVGITFGYLTFFPSELDLWVDEKDERIWLLTPTTLIALPAAAQYFFWEKVRLPFGATLLVLALMTGEWLTRYFMWGWTLFPVNMVWVSIVIPGAVLLDVLLLWTRSYIITGVLGSLVWGLIFYPVNWAILARFRQPVEYNGMLMALADVIGYQNVRSIVIPGTPPGARPAGG